jgi:hypothetical protein
LTAGLSQHHLFASILTCAGCASTGQPDTGVSHFSALKTASQRENIQKISENAIAGWVIVLEEYGIIDP